MPLTTLSIITLQPGHARWALAQMGTAPPLLQKVAGLRFHKLAGSGADNGFGLWPNWRRYGLMAVWETPDAAAEFFAAQPQWLAYQQRAAETWTAYLAPLQAHGLWDGVNPFDYQTAKPAPDAPVAVLTRAAIRVSKLRGFWRHMAPAVAAVAQAPGVRASIGLGELPFVRQATFSLWESARQMQHYAYRDATHREVIQRTRREQWYSEELFARFEVLRTEGTWDGRAL